MLVLLALFLAQDAAIQADPARSSVQFTLGDVLHTVSGSFQIKSGSARIDLATGKASGRIVVDVKSGSTGGAVRDRRMHKEILQSDRYPEAVFTLSRVSGPLSPEGDSQVEVSGLLLIHGQNHDIAFPAKVQIHNGQITATAAFTMPYVSWGMKNPSNFLLKVDDHVALMLTCRARFSLPGSSAPPP